MKKILSFIKNNYVIIFFLIIYLIGLFTFKNYGTYDDERMQYNHSIVSYYTIKNTFLGKDNCDNLFVDKTLEDTCINTYPYKYYGVSFQLPLVLIEKVFHLNISDTFYMRHFFMFLLYFISLICLFKITNKYIFHDKRYSLLAVLFMILSPRIYGDIFYNIKDGVLLSLSIINIYAAFKYLENEKIGNLILLCFMSAFTINTRIIGALIFFITFIYHFIKNRKDIKYNLLSSLLMIIITYILYILITPSSWSNPFTFPFEVLSSFYNYSDPLSHINFIVYHFGKIYLSNNLPWSYLPIWIIITTPALYLLLFIIGFTKNIICLIKRKNINKYIVYYDLLFVFVLIFIMITRPVMYYGWRFFYFIYPAIIIDAIIGLKLLLQSKKTKIIFYLIITINSINIIMWMILNHPYEYEYYSYPSDHFAYKDFSYNFYQVSNKNAVDYIINHSDDKDIRIFLVNYTNKSYNYLINNDNITFVRKKSDANYIVNINYKGNYDVNEYTLLYTEYIDNKYPLYFIYKRNE